MLCLRGTARLALTAAAIAVCLSVPARADSNNDDDELLEDVLACEDALGHLGRCCGGFDARAVRCHYHDDRTSGGCGGPSTIDRETPALSMSESLCIRNQSCDTLVASGVCDRAQAATAYWEKSQSSGSGDTTTTGTGSSHAPVCP